MKSRYSPILLAVAGVLFVGCADTPSGAGSGPPAIGDIAPDFSQNDTSGHPVSLSQFRGKVVLLDFWATWCGPCINALPKFREVWKVYRDKDFVILSVSLDRNLGDWRKFIRDNNIDWHHTSDGQYWNNAVAQLYRVNGIPQAYLLDKSGKVIAINTFTYAQIDEALKQ